MIDHKNSLSMSEASEYVKEKELQGFMKKFIKIKKDKTSGLRKKIEELNIIKLNPKNVTKIIDFLPEDKEDLNKILTDVNLDENETNTILQTIKEFI